MSVVNVQQEGTTYIVGTYKYLRVSEEPGRAQLGILSMGLRPQVAPVPGTGRAQPKPGALHAAGERRHCPSPESSLHG